MSGKAAQAIRVLVVDDQRAMRSIIRNLLSQNNINQVAEAEDGVEALRNLLDATAVLGKPISAPDLCRHIERAVGFAFSA